MPENFDKYSKMLDELAREYPELEADAMALQDAMVEGADPMAGAEDPEMPFDFSEEDEEMPSPKKGKKIPPELADEEEEDDEDLF